MVWGRGARVTALLAPQELVSKLLHLHFKDDKTKGGAPAWGGKGSWGCGGSIPGQGSGRGRSGDLLPPPAVSGDALLLVAELLKVFVVGESVLLVPVCTTCLPFAHTWP